MSADDEILADFLIESEELINDLGQQILDLEETPDDKDLLNAVFRSFHTVKGGAGFLELTTLVDLCHTAEELCNGLRNGKLTLDPEMVDALSAAVDHLQQQHASLSAGEEAEPADPELLKRLHSFSHPEATEPAQAGSTEAQTGADPERLETEEDFEALFDQMHGVAAKEEPTKSPDATALETEDDFEALLDEMHGIGPKPAADTQEEPEAKVEPAPAPDPAAAEKSETQPKAKPAADAKKAGDKPAVEASIRVETSRLDAVMNLVGELVLARNHLKMLSRNLSRSDDPEDVGKVSGRVDRVTTELQNAVMKMRMQAIRKVFSRFPRIVRDLARSLGKDVKLELVGEDTELDKNLVEALADPLIHLVRNSVDHGIESPEKRRAAGKPEQGVVRLSAHQEGDDIVILIEDDGGGIDPNVLRARAIERGVLEQDEAARMEASDCYKIIFMPGFSTRDEVSDVSGRGVGMDVVKTRIDHLNGQINITSEVGQGSTMELRVPLTLAILASLMVRAGQRIFAVPLSSVDDVMMFDSARVTLLDGRRVYMLDGQPLPLLMLGMWCGEIAEMPERAHLILMRHGSDRFGIVVDSVIGREEVVIKPLGPPLEELAGFSGATVTGDGRVALILDPISLFRILRERSLVD